jgi:hypothetical protein
MAYESEPLDILPGIFMEASRYASQGRYVDGSNVRFWKGFPERIGGNSRIADQALYRPGRAMQPWRSLGGTQFVAFGHALGVQLFQSGSLTDISPVGSGGYSTLTLAVSSISGAFTAGETVTTANGGSAKLVAGGSSSPLLISGDNGTAKLALTGMSGSFLDGETVVASGGGTARVRLGGSSSPLFVYDDSGTFTGTLTGQKSGATGTISSKTTLWTGTLTGGSSGKTATVDLVSQTHPTDTGTSNPWGGSTWGDSVWGGADSLFSSTSDAQVWEFCNWGEDLIAVPRGGAVYSFDTSAYIADPTTNLVPISNAPATALGCFLNQSNRTLILFGAHDGSQNDSCNIRWCDEEDFTDWTADPSNTAGSIRCESGSLIRGAMSAKNTFLISTDTVIYTFQYVGLPFVFALNQIATGSVLIAPHAWAEQDGITYWMGEKGFYQYDGAVYPLPCDVHEFIFGTGNAAGNLNAVQSFKIYCGTLRAFNEIWWFYVSNDATDFEVDKYVCYNTVEKTWHIGDKARTCWIDKSVVLAYPIAAKANGSIHAEEFGATDDGQSIDYFLRTSDVEINDGTTILHNRMLIPDYERITGTHNLSVISRGWPARSPTTKGPFPTSETTETISVRARGRTLQFEWSGSDDFRMGRWRYRVTGHGENP